MSSSHDNNATIACASIISITYIDNSLVITDGQPSTLPPTITQSGTTWSITMNCGRSGSSTVANQFTSKSGGVNHVISPYSWSDKSPSNLNFYFGVTVCFNIQNETFYTDLYLGQGNVGTTNNWWIGGKNVAVLYNSVGIIAIPTVPGGYINEVFSITGGVSNFNLNPYIDASNSNEQANWMKTIANATLITDINIPGTHDSAAINGYIHTPYACHYNTISKQLLYGVRLLDIRLSVKYNATTNTYTFTTCHGDITLGVSLNEYQSFSSLLDECKTFLTANPTEFIAMSIKIDSWNGIPDSQKNDAYSALATLLASYPTFAQSTIPTLASSRGKIFLMNRMNTSLSLGVPIYWADNTSGAISASQTNRNFQLYVQDQYKNLGNDTETAEQDKYNLFVAALENASSGQMLLNYASATQDYIMGVYIMDTILQYFGDNDAAQRPVLLGWSLFDYITSNYSTSTYGNINVLQMVISSNFGYSAYPSQYTVDIVDEPDDL